MNGAPGEKSANPVDNIKRYLGCEHLLYLSSGRAAQWVALKALSRLMPDRNEVIIPAYSCPSVVSATLKAGLRPVLCDINLQDFGFLHEELEKTVNARTLAVIVVHLYGYPVRIDPIQKLCRENNTYLVEDAAQAFGNTFREHPDMKLGLAGDAGFFSFGRGKPLNIMHGGLLTTKSADIYKEADSIYTGLNGCSQFQNVKYSLSLGLYSLFSTPYLYWLPQMLPILNLGGTEFESEFTITRGLGVAASLASVMTENIEEEKNVRQENAKWYSDHLRDVCAGEGPDVCECTCLRYPLLIFDAAKRTKILDRLVSKGTGATGSYPTPLNELPGLKDVLKDNTRYENAGIMSESIITLPVHSRVTERDRENIVNIIKQVLDEN